MLEQLIIFTRGGLILWACKEMGSALIKGSPVDTLIRSCLLEDRSGASSYNYDASGASYSLKWTFHNELGLVFVAVYQRILHLLYVDDLLAMVKREFSEIYDPKRMVYNDFDETFRQLRKEAEARAEEMKSSKQVGKPANNSAKNQGQGKKAGYEAGNKKKSEGGSGSDGGDGDNGRKLENGHLNGNHIGIDESSVVGAVDGKENTSSNIGAFDTKKLMELKPKGGKKKDNVKKKDSVNKDSKAKPKKQIKKDRMWGGTPQESKLDYTDPVNENGDENIAVVADQGESMMDREEVISSESEAEEDEEVEKDNKLDTKKKGWFSSMFQRLMLVGRLS